MEKVEYDLKFDDSLSLIKLNYPGQFPRQMPVFLQICLDQEPVRVVADTWNYDISGTPMNEYHGHVQSFRLPDTVDAAALDDWAQSELGEIIQTLADSYYSEWDGNNNVARGIDEDLLAIIADACHDAPCLPDGGLWDVGDWLSDITHRPTSDSPTGDVDDRIITAGTSDKQLEEWAKELIDFAGSENVVLDGDVLDYLSMIRDECRNYADQYRVVAPAGYDNTPFYASDIHDAVMAGIDLILNDGSEWPEGLETIEIMVKNIDDDNESVVVHFDSAGNIQ